jgi:hypothetical protein
MPFVGIRTEGATSTVTIEAGKDDGKVKTVEAKLVALPGGNRISVSGLKNDQCNGTFFNSKE